MSEDGVLSSTDWKKFADCSFSELAQDGTLYLLSLRLDSVSELYRKLGGNAKNPTGSFRQLLNESKQFYEDALAEELEQNMPEITDSQLKMDAYKRQIGKLKGQVEKYREFYGQLGDLIKTTFEPLPPIRVPKPTTNSKADHAAIQPITDIHVGEWVRGSETADLSEYNYDIFLKRRDTLLDAFTNQISDFRRAYKLNTLYILGLGDWCTGEDVFHMQQARVDLLVGEQIIVASQEMARTILAMAEQFSHTEVYLQWGNHGKERNTTNNNDITIYLMVKMLLSNQENISIHISPSTFNAFGIGPDNGYVDFGDCTRKYNYIIFHGQEAQRYMGVPWYGIRRAKMRFDQMVRQVSDFMFIGHHHTDAQCPDEGWGCTSSWVGGTGYSVSTMQACSRPSQRLYYFTPKYGLASSIQLFLDDEPALPEPLPDGSKIKDIEIPTLD
jgi:hypothetical protein